MADVLTAERLREVLSYDAETGAFRWKEQLAPRGKIGMIAGNVADATRRRTIRIDKKLYLEHRLVWLFVHGRWPTNQIDHIDGDPGNNRLANLREATQSQNNFNQGLRRNNSSGIKGVSWDAARKKWAARISANGKVRALGRFETKEDAARAHHFAALTYHGDFARLGA